MKSSNSLAKTASFNIGDKSILAHMDAANARRGLVIAPLIGIINLFVYIMRTLGLSKNTSPYPHLDILIFVLTLTVCIVFLIQSAKELKEPSHKSFVNYTYAFCFMILLNGSYFQVVDSGVVPFFMPMAAVYVVFLLHPFPAALIMAFTGITFTLYRLLAGDLIVTYAVVIFIICLISLYGSSQNYLKFIEEELNIKEIRKLVYQDRLTEALNLEGFRLRVRDILEQNPDTPYFLSYNNIRNFKFINERYGMETGDKLLKFWADQTLAALSPTDALGCISGDRFIILRHIDNKDAFQKDGNTVVEKVKNYFIDQGIEYRVQIRSGIYILSKDDYLMPDIDRMIDCARVAQDGIKDSPALEYAIYNPERWEKRKRVDSMTGHLKDALASGEVEVWYQPQMDYENGNLVGAEVLCRWIHPELGLIYPAEFMPALEESGQSYELDKYVWRRACAQLQAWNRQGIHFSLSVNLARNDLAEGKKLTAYLIGLLDTYGLTPDQLRIEITEGAYMENSDLLREVVSQLMEANFTVEMDNFGSAYSSLRMLTKVPVDIIKLDLDFLTDQEDPQKGLTIIKYMTKMLQSLSLNVIAKGVESKEQADFLLENGCRLMQGFFFSKPIPANVFDKMLLQEKNFSA